MNTREFALIMNPDGTPATIELAGRNSTSAPGRVKACFTVDVEEGSTVRLPDGTTKALEETGPVALTPEFRIEVTS
jgi:hypothetical protein